jgi:hypothetical protein
VPKFQGGWEGGERIIVDRVMQVDGCLGFNFPTQLRAFISSRDTALLTCFLPIVKFVGVEWCFFYVFSLWVFS